MQLYVCCRNCTAVYEDSEMAWKLRSTLTGKLLNGKPIACFVEDNQQLQKRSRPEDGETAKSNDEEDNCAQDNLGRHADSAVKEIKVKGKKHKIAKLKHVPLPINAGKKSLKIMKMSNEFKTKKIDVIGNSSSDLKVKFFCDIKKNI